MSHRETIALRLKRFARLLGGLHHEQARADALDAMRALAEAEIGTPREIALGHAVELESMVAFAERATIEKMIGCWG